MLCGLQTWKLTVWWCQKVSGMLSVARAELPWDTERALGHNQLDRVGQLQTVKAEIQSLQKGLSGSLSSATLG